MNVYDGFSTTMAELSVCHRDSSIAPKALKYLLYVPSQKNFASNLIQFPHLYLRKSRTNTVSNWHNNTANHFSSQDKIQVF